MAMISMSFLECPNCKAKMQSVTTMKCGMFFHIWTCIHCGDYYDRQELIEKGVLDQTDDPESLFLDDEAGCNYEKYSMLDFCEECHNPINPNRQCKRICPLFED